MKIILETFYSAYRSQFGNIKQNSTVQNINTMLDAFVKFADWINPLVAKEQLAYISATVLHETAGTYGSYKERRQVSTNTPQRLKIRKLQDRYWNTGYYGRGPVQLTWEYNYKWAQELTGAPLLKDPDLLLTNLLLGYEVCIKGMAEGAFTGKSLNHYINARTVDYVGARRIVNGHDKASLIASYALKFERIFSSCLEDDK